MANLTAEIDNLKRDLERSRTELSRMYLELGETAANWHHAIAYAPSQESYERLSAVAQQKAEIDAKIAALKAAMDDMSISDRKIEQTKISMKELDSRYSVLISSLGAVAIEIDSQGKLPQRLLKCLEPMREHEKRLEAFTQKRDKYAATGSKMMASFYDNRIKGLMANLDEVFADTGRRIYNSGDFREVPGQRAKGILDEMEQIRFMKKNYKNDILDNRNAIDEAQGSLRTMGAFGEENRRLRELQSQQDQIADRLSDRYTEYGNILADGMQYWIDGEAPEELQKCCTQIIRQEKRIAQQNLNLEHCMMERDIEIHNMQLSMLSEQMNHLNSQIQSIENQKAELQLKLDAELKAVSDLRMRQSELTQQASLIQ